ncbi:type II toxin-antitoxin system PemK/MazF family toxin [Schleiferilactobacillus shenzhenensis]|uniref:type II toxin-antitoxin system PemK/MazF family toxin n=1 Tax=Schleiferilactobacillus shenzhenensis TaxID=1231337 RepID=UPI00058ED7A7|nr:type II toxin-antitoxin system PemK/MazF family toxin [Schleiferilactobacillus shenzhenensis]
MRAFPQGTVLYVDLDPAQGNEQKKNRPCVVVSNDDYNRYFNTVIVVPISSSAKYVEEDRYRDSPLFIQVKAGKVSGTALLQHVRSVDLTKRSDGKVTGVVSQSAMRQISDGLQHFF